MSDVPGAKKVGDTPVVSDPVAIPKEKSSSSDFDLSTKVSNMGDLEKKAPEVHEKMMEGIAQRIIAGMRKHAARHKELMREMSRANERRR